MFKEKIMNFFLVLTHFYVIINAAAVNLSKKFFHLITCYTAASDSIILSLTTSVSVKIEVLITKSTTIQKTVEQTCLSETKYIISESALLIFDSIIIKIAVTSASSIICIVII